jgi:hypothetical protein
MTDLRYVMEQLTVELDDREMAVLHSAARARSIDPTHMTKLQLLNLLTAQKPSAARAKRLAAIMSVHGIWKDDPTKPKDGVDYQREMRAEWR